MNADDERVAELAELAEAGLAAATLVHEVRQPLFALRAMAQIGEEAGGLGPEHIRELLGVVSHLEGLLGAWGDVGRREEPRLYDAREVVASVSRLLESRARLIGASLHVSADRPVWAHGSPSAARQVALNLMQNALDAVVGAPERVVRVCALTEGGRVGLEVRDSGMGVAEPARAHVFEAFFTTKGQGGTGLGLWVARRLCEASGGTLVLEHLPDGTRAFGQVASSPEGTPPGGPMKNA